MSVGKLDTTGLAVLTIQMLRYLKATAAGLVGGVIIGVVAPLVFDQFGLRLAAVLTRTLRPVRLGLVAHSRQSNQVNDVACFLLENYEILARQRIAADCDEQDEDGRHESKRIQDPRQLQH